jgi:hypothetical protein
MRIAGRADKASQQRDARSARAGSSTTRSPASVAYGGPSVQGPRRTCLPELLQALRDVMMGTAEWAPLGVLISAPLATVTVSSGQDRGKGLWEGWGGHLQLCSLKGQYQVQRVKDGRVEAVSGPSDDSRSRLWLLAVHRAASLW